MKRYREHFKSKASSSDDGFILVIVLIVIAVLFPAILVFNSKTQINVLQAINFKDNVQAIRLARSGVEGAMGLLRADDPAYDSKKDIWAMDFPQLAVGEGMLYVKIVDEDSKININQLIRPNGVDVDPYVEGRLRLLITRLGGKPEVVDALIDWMDADSEVKGSAGAENEYYKAFGMTPKNGPVDTIDELFMIKGFDKDLLVDKGLKYYITVVPTDGKININTAPKEVLFDISDRLRDGLVEEIIRYREDREYKTVDDVVNTLGIDAATAGVLKQYIKVNSTYFTVHSRYKVGKIVKNVEAVIRRQGKAVSVFSWREF
ncbi:MAG: type II secretion system minor pseudopilin GspK [Syntrophorhabdaceae bacterium]|nr:type II secretion system minor pseudopilin GspK [Syntrophorhabdaceae bacterium]